MTRLQVIPTAPLPINQLVLGKPVTQALDLLPRIFNLCQGAQRLALRMACGLSYDDTDLQALRAEITRDHRMRLDMLLPAQLGVASVPVPDIAPDGTLRDVCETVPLLAALRDRFDAGEAVTTGPENSVAERQAHHPLMQEAEILFGRGPLWRTLARCLDRNSPLPRPVMDGGWACVPAARGIYRVRAGVLDGTLTAFERRTPTDDMLAPGGTIDQSLASLPDSKSDLAPLVLDILDPCVPLELRQVHHA